MPSSSETTVATVILGLTVTQTPLVKVAGAVYNSSSIPDIYLYQGINAPMKQFEHHPK